MLVKGGLSLLFDPTEIGPVSLVATVDGPALKFDRGLINVYELIRDHLIMNEVAKSAHIEQSEGDRLRWSMDTDAELYDVLCSRGAIVEDDEDNGNGEDDSRSLPRSSGDLDGRPSQVIAASILGVPARETATVASSLAA